MVFMCAKCVVELISFLFCFPMFCFSSSVLVFCSQERFHDEGRDVGDRWCVAGRALLANRSRCRRPSVTADWRPGWHACAVRRASARR